MLFQDLIFQALDKEFDAYISDLDPDTMTHEEKDSNKNAFIEVFFNGGPVAFPDGMDYVVCNEHTMLSWYLRRRSTNETPDLQEVGRISVDRSESNIMSLPLDRRNTKLLMTNN